jgi:redox-sensitive bicupin YhaK (pirin superfamily)
MNRNIQSIHPPTLAQDGAGVKLKRFFPVAGFDNVDPFMLLDHFGSDNPDDYIAGFPLHPHRGIETVTYMLDGRIRHKDSTGRRGTIEAGDVQWMCAGRGIMHEEMPEVANGRLDGFQLWVNLPAKDKMKKAQYQEYAAKDITVFEHQGHVIRLISGSLFGHQGVVRHISSLPTYADITLNTGRLTLEIPANHNAFIYVFRGALALVNDAGKKNTITAPNLAVLTQGDRLDLQTESKARILMISGQANNEPVARSGPFVMNTRAEIAQTWREIQSGSFPPDS